MAMLLAVVVENVVRRTVSTMLSPGPRRTRGNERYSQGRYLRMQREAAARAPLAAVPWMPPVPPVLSLPPALLVPLVPPGLLVPEGCVKADEHRRRAGNRPVEEVEKIVGIEGSAGRLSKT